MVDPLIGTLAALATYSVGFFARPVGGIVFGHYGDKLGRKAVLVTTLILMGISTACIGLLPSYDSIGIAAPIMLLVLRILQGFGAGAEYSGAVIMAVEHAPPKRRGLHGSWPRSACRLAVYVIFMSVISFVAVFLGPETKDVDLGAVRPEERELVARAAT